MKENQTVTNETTGFVNKSEGISPMSLGHHDVF